MFEWTKSVRALAAIIFVLGMTAGLFMNKISAEMFGQASMLVIGAYFARRDSEAERNADQKIVDDKK